MKIPLRDDIFAATCVTAGVVVLAWVGKCTRAERSRAPQITRAAKELINQANVWSEMSDQDSELVYRIVHLTLAAAYCNAARVLAPDDELFRASNVDVHARLREIEAAQRKVLSKLQRGGGAGSKKVLVKGTAISSNAPTWK